LFFSGLLDVSKAILDLLDDLDLIVLVSQVEFGVIFCLENVVFVLTFLSLMALFLLGVELKTFSTAMLLTTWLLEVLMDAMMALVRKNIMDS
jgi:vacuolar-type H+-ATPase subunit I/STV1